jgi:glycosyltransferase involved in cell wall biosynthesis
MDRNNQKKVALVHDFLTGIGGAENVVGAIAEIYKDSDVFTLFSDKKILSYQEFNWIRKRRVFPTFLQFFPKFLKNRKKWLLPFMPTAIETLDFRDYDLVISSSGAYAKGIVVKSKTLHICYMHSPLRYVWDWNHQYLEENNLKGKPKIFTRLFLNYLRLWDRSAAMRPDYLIANSKYTQERIKKYYRRKSEVIYPPVEVKEFQPTKENLGYYLTVGRLSTYKRIDKIIEAFEKLDLPLVIVGDGKERKKLEKKVEGLHKIRILGGVDRKKLIKLYENCKAFVFACEDDFGIAPVEAMAAGKPVIALREGGVRETVIEGVTGEFFNEASAEMIADGVRRFIKNEKKYNINQIRQRAEEFEAGKFEFKLRKSVSEIEKKHFHQ